MERHATAAHKHVGAKGSDLRRKLRLVLGNFSADVGHRVTIERAWYWSRREASSGGGERMQPTLPEFLALWSRMETIRREGVAQLDLPNEAEVVRIDNHHASRYPTEPGPHVTLDISSAVSAF